MGTYTEAAGAGRVASVDLALFSNGVHSMLHHLAILPEAPPKLDHRPLVLYGDGDLDHGVLAEQRGFFIGQTELLRPVHPGERIGHVRGLDGELLQACTAPREGVVVALRALPVVHSGDLLCHLADGFLESPVMKIPV